MKMKLIISTSCFSLTLRVLNTKRLTRLTASADTDPPPGVPDIHGHQLSSIRAVKYHISVYGTKSQILCACKQKVRCHVPVTKKSDVMFLLTKSQRSSTCKQKVRCYVPVNKQLDICSCKQKGRCHVPVNKQSDIMFL